MTVSGHESEQFSGLILLTGEDEPGLAHALFEALSPFSVAVVDIDQIIIKDRLILTVQISLNPAHQHAIEEDLDVLANSLGIDVASVFSTSKTPQTKLSCLTLKVSSAKLHPKSLDRVTRALFDAGANIEDFSRTGIDPLELTIKISGISQTQLNEVIASAGSGTEFSLVSGN